MVVSLVVIIILQQSVERNSKQSRWSDQWLKVVFAASQVYIVNEEMNLWWYKTIVYETIIFSFSLLQNCQTFHVWQLWSSNFDFKQNNMVKILTNASTNIGTNFVQSWWKIWPIFFWHFNKCIDQHWWNFQTILVAILTKYLWIFRPMHQPTLVELSTNLVLNFDQCIHQDAMKKNSISTK